MKQKMIYLREYQKEFEEEAESFNLAGFVRQALDAHVIPNEQIPEEYRPEAVSNPLIEEDVEAVATDFDIDTQNHD